MTPEEETLVLIKLVIVFITIIKTSKDMLVINGTGSCKKSTTNMHHTHRFYVPHDVGDVVPPQQYHCI